MRKVTIRTDGSCLNNGLENARGGGAICVYEDNAIIYTKCFKPCFETLTETRCEALALLEALRFLKEHKDIKATIQLDSKALVDGILGTARRKANRDLWEPIEELFPSIESQIVAIQLIASEENYDADKLANQAANALFVENKGEWIK